jgi:hypothetical protein
MQPKHIYEMLAEKIYTGMVTDAGDDEKELVKRLYKK